MSSMYPMLLAEPACFTTDAFATAVRGMLSR
jgi:hypothetical protein